VMPFAGQSILTTIHRIQKSNPKNTICTVAWNPRILKIRQNHLEGIFLKPRAHGLSSQDSLSAKQLDRRLVDTTLQSKL
jgi:hypothetical protein